MKADPLVLRDFAERYTASWCSQDPARVAAFFSPGASLTVNDGAPAIGREQITELARSFITAFPDLKVSLADLRIGAESIEYHWTLSGTNSGPGGTGKNVRIDGFEEWQIGADGLIASSRGHFDAAEYQRQLQHGV
jgi:hypothetical protein